MAGAGGAVKKEWKPQSGAMFRESRRSTRVPLRVVIKAQGIAEPLTCEGETIIVSLHGALISTAIALRMKIEILVYLTGKHAKAEVVYVDPEKPCTAESRWRCHGTFGEYLCPRKTGMKAI